MGRSKSDRGGLEGQRPDSKNDAKSRLAGKRILIVEDEFIIAIEYAQHLESLGATVVGPVTTVTQALDVLRQGRVDAAVLDVDLQGVKAFDVADYLIEHRIGFIFATGYDDAFIPDRFAGVLRCGKPARPEAIADALCRVTSN